MTTTTTENTKIHPFQKAGLGLAPFRFDGVTERVYQACHGAPIQPGSSCDFCGTAIRYEYWILSADNRKSKVGCDCIFKLNQSDKLTSDAKRAKRDHDRAVREARKQAKREERRAARKAQAAEAAEAYVKDNPEFAGLLTGEFDGNAILKDMARNLREWGSLTPNQEAFARNLIEEMKANGGMTEREREEAEYEAAKKPAPEGRVEVEGKVVHFKTVQGFGYNQTTLKMLVICDGFKVWCTAPTGGDDFSKGDRIRFTVTLTRSDKDEDFAFGKRPTKLVNVTSKEVA